MTSVHNHHEHDPYVFNPFEIAFSGYSNSGKTTLICKLLKELSPHYSIGYVKHDAHRFEMDIEGKDTFSAKQNGAKTIYINDSFHSTCLQAEQSQPRHPLFTQSDFVLIEGYKQSKIPKIQFLDQGSVPLNNTIATISQTDQVTPQSTPHFHRDDITRIKEFILTYFKINVSTIPLFGLVLTGGKSTRMKTDKAKLNYTGVPEQERLVKLLNRFCNEVYISSRTKQNSLDSTMIADRFVDFGPIGGILSAMKTHREAAWLVLACDLPFLNEKTIQTLVSNRNPYKCATAFMNADNTFPEPLCAIYEPKSFHLLLDTLQFQKPCPRKLLMQNKPHLLTLLEPQALMNVNTPEEYKRTLEVLHERTR